MSKSIHQQQQEQKSLEELEATRRARRLATRAHRLDGSVAPVA